MAAGQLGVSVYSGTELEELSLHLDAIEEWLRESCSARRADDMADVVEKASKVIYDLFLERDDDA